MPNKSDIAHFERLGRSIAKSRVYEPLPRTLREVVGRMLAINPRCGMGTYDLLGGDLASHLAYIEYREAWVKKCRGRGETS